MKHIFAGFGEPSSARMPFDDNDDLGGLDDYNPGCESSGTVSFCSSRFAVEDKSDRDFHQQSSGTRITSFKL